MNIDFDRGYSVNFGISNDGTVDFTMDGETTETTDYNMPVDYPSVNFDILSNNAVDFTIGGQAGTTDYNMLENKPRINAVELIGNKTSNQLYLQDKMDVLTNNDIEELLNNFV